MKIKINDKEILKAIAELCYAANMVADSASLKKVLDMMSVELNMREE